MDMTDRTPPLKPAAFYILLVLADQDLHGYAVMQAVRERSGGRVPLQTGSFYRHLSQLLQSGFVVEAPAKRGTADPRRGAEYRLTARGRQVLDAERRHLASLVAPMRPASRKGLA
jgi:DNA-binding PadR family transcriptional regulator